MRGREEGTLKPSALARTLLRIVTAILMAVLSLEGAFLAFTLFIGFALQSQLPGTEPVFFLMWSTRVPWVLAGVGVLLGVIAVVLPRFRLLVLWLLGSVGYCAAAAVGLFYTKAGHAFSGGGWVLAFFMAPVALPLVLFFLWMLEVQTRPEPVKRLPR